MIGRAVCRPGEVTVAESPNATNENFTSITGADITRTRRDAPAIPGDEPVGELGDGRKAGEALVTKQGESAVGIFCANTQCRACATVDCSIRLNEMNGGYKIRLRDFRESRRHVRVLKREKIHQSGAVATPALHPATAKSALAVIDQQRSDGRNLNSCRRSHSDKIEAKSGARPA